MSNEGGDSHGGVGVWVVIRVGSNQKLGVSLALLTSVDQSCGRVDIGSSGQGNVGAVGGLGSVVLGSSNSHVGVERSHSTVRVGHQTVSSNHLGVG